MNITTVGLDIAKNVFYAHGVDGHGKVVMQRKLTRGKVLTFFAKIPACRIGIEATGSAHYWARELMKFGHTVKLMPAQYVKAYVKRDKNDPNDAAGICDAVSRPSMRFAAINTVEQQDMLMLHAIRQRLMQQRTAALNQIRRLLAEYGVVFNQGANSLRRGITELLGRESHGLTGRAVELIKDVQEQITAMDERLAAYDARVKRACQSDPRCQEIEALPGIGPLTATALVAKVGDGKQFQRARQMGSCLGLKRASTAAGAGSASTASASAATPTCARREESRSRSVIALGAARSRTPRREHRRRGLGQQTGAHRVGGARQRAPLQSTLGRAGGVNKTIEVTRNTC